MAPTVKEARSNELAEMALLLVSPPARPDDRGRCERQVATPLRPVRGYPMSALTFRRTGDLELYRSATTRQASTPGVTAPSFRCKSCNQVKRTAGRKQRVKGYSKAGYVCRDCAPA